MNNKSYIGLRLDPELHAWLRRRSTQNHESVSALVRRVLYAAHRRDTFAIDRPVVIRNVPPPEPER